MSTPRRKDVRAPGEPSRQQPVRTGDGSLTLRDEEAGQTYGSDRGALTEARHVFLHGSGVADRLASGLATRVLEVGLGTGLNFLVSADAAVAAGARLDYRALELRLPPAEVLERLDYGSGLRRPEIFEAWLAARRAWGEGGPPPARWALPEGTLAPGVALEVHVGNAAQPGAPGAEPGWADAIYHDAFSPDAAPELWSEAFLGRLASALAPGGVLVSYSVKGVVRRRLAAAGLRVERRPGPPGGKRQMLFALRPEVSPRGPGSDPTG